MHAQKTLLLAPTSIDLGTDLKDEIFYNFNLLESRTHKQDCILLNDMGKIQATINCYSYFRRT